MTGRIAGRRAPVELRGAHAIITGGSSGIGLATAHRLAARGANVSLLARGVDRLAAAADAVRAGAPGCRVLTAPVDVADQAALVSALDGLVAAGGPCDVLVTSAGEARPGRFLELDDDQFRSLIEIDYFGTLWAIRAVAPSMAERPTGSIVAISSAAAVLGIYGYSAYGPAKFAVRGLVESLRDELTPHGIHIGCVFPPDTDTPQLADENRYKPSETAAISGKIKPISADRVAEAIVHGIDHRRARIYADRQTAVLAALAPLARPLVDRIIDRTVARATATAGTPATSTHKGPPTAPAGSAPSPAEGADGPAATQGQ